MNWESKRERESEEERVDGNKQMIKHGRGLFTEKWGDCSDSSGLHSVTTLGSFKGVSYPDVLPCLGKYEPVFPTHKKRHRNQFIPDWKECR